MDVFTKVFQNSDSTDFKTLRRKGIKMEKISEDTLFKTEADKASGGKMKFGGNSMEIQGYSDSKEGQVTFVTDLKKILESDLYKKAQPKSKYGGRLNKKHFENFIKKIEGMPFEFDKEPEITATTRGKDEIARTAALGTSRIKEAEKLVNDIKKVSSTCRAEILKSTTKARKKMEKLKKLSIRTSNEDFTKVIDAMIEARETKWDVVDKTINSGNHRAKEKWTANVKGWWNKTFSINKKKNS